MKDCHNTALSYLEHRDRSTYEVKAHLISKGFQEDEIEAELICLKELRYVDDARYCVDYMRYGMSKGRGPVRLQHELREKGIDAELIQASLEEHFSRDAEHEAALKEAGKILRADERPDEKMLSKIGRRLSAQGYHSQVIYDVIGKVRKP